MATQRFYDGQPGPDIRRELNNFEAILDGTVAAAQSASTAATSASVKAQQWADAEPGVEVEAGKYSAKHWAARAQTTVTGGLVYRGSHSAASGAYPATPSLGDYYKISAAGTLGGVAYSVGDSIIYNGTDWDKIDSTDAVTSVAGRVGEVTLTKTDVGLGNVDNTSDANKPISTATQTALNAKLSDAPSDGKQYARKDAAWAEVVGDVTGPASSVNHSVALFDGTTGKLLKVGGVLGTAAYRSVAATGNASTTQVVMGSDTRLTDARPASDVSAWAKAATKPTYTKSEVGLTNVDNTSDANKPISTATQNALNSKLDKTGGDIFGNVNIPSLNGGQLAGLRNKIINGKMEIAQRGTSFAPVVSAFHTLDRWLAVNTSAGVVTISQQADVPISNEFQNSLRVAVTAADTSIAAGDVASIQHRVEGFNARDLIGRAFTLSFWVRSSKTGVHCIGFSNSTEDRTYVADYTVNAADTWEFKTVTVSGGLITAGTWDWANGIGLMVKFTYACGSTFQTTAGAWQPGNFYATANQVNCLDTVGNIFAFTGVQLEVGEVATPFEHRPHGLELDLARRYTRVYAATKSTADLAYEMRATPTQTGSGPYTYSAEL